MVQIPGYQVQTGQPAPTGNSTKETLDTNYLQTLKLLEIGVAQEAIRVFYGDPGKWKLWWKL